MALGGRCEVVETGGDRRASSLDLRTQLGEIHQWGGWYLSTWKECSEASLVWISPHQKESPGRRPKSVLDLLESRPDLAAYVDKIAALQVEKGLANWSRSNGRAASRSRRYFVVNQLRYMWVLTFATSPESRNEVMTLTSEFARQLRAANGGRPFPYWYSPELHPGGHGWHVNYFVPHRLEHRDVERIWGHGWVWVVDYAKAARSKHGEPLGLCRTPRDAWRRAAQYGCKYAQKDWSPEHVGASNHRYDVAQGFQPTPVRQWVKSRREADGIIFELAGRVSDSDVEVWDSNDEPKWDKPPVVTWRW